MVTPRDILSAFAEAYALSRHSPAGGADLSQALERLRSRQGELGWTVVRVAENGFTVLGEPVPTDEGELGPFREALDGAGIQEVRLQSVPEPGVFLDFFSRIDPSAAAPEILPSARFRGVAGRIGLSYRRAGAEVPGMVGQVQRLFSTREPVPGSFDGAMGGPQGEKGIGAGAGQEEDVGPGLSAGREFAEEVGAFLISGEPERSERRGRILARGREMAKVRNLAGLAGLIQLLVESGGEGPGNGEPIEIGRELAGPAVTSYLVGKLGSTKDVLERERLTRLLSRIGWEAATALADALGEARDRFQRRVFMEAMTSLGPHALERAQRMVEDPRWFVVRNGVALLGEMGGEDVVSYLTATLADEEPRVRKESVRSLAKVGGRDAEMLVAGMLNDGEASVRVAACQALGALKSSRSVKPLIDALKDESLDVQVESLRALGQIGDPGVVRTIEKRALGGLFTRGTTEVRVAAFRALAGIGTPGALRALEKGSADSDPTVRTVVRTLIKSD